MCPRYEGKPTDLYGADPTGLLAVQTFRLRVVAPVGARVHRGGDNRLSRGVS
jgi:hypothetical protein